MPGALLLVALVHASASLFFLYRALSDFPVRPVLRSPRRILLLPFVALLALLPLPLLPKAVLLPAYALAVTHYARQGAASRGHAVFLALSGLSLIPLLAQPLLPVLAVACAAALLLRGSRETEHLPHVARAEYAYLPPDARHASALTLLLFGWMTPIVDLGRRRPLQSEDVAGLAPPLCAAAVGEGVLRREWEAELGRPAGPSLWRALGRAFGGQLVSASLLKALNDVCIFVSPMVLRRIILVLQAPAGASGAAGYALAGVMLVTYALQSMLFNQYFNINSLVQVKVRGALIHAIFAKSCRLSAGARAQFSSGNIQNMMATDSRTVADLALYVNMLWSAMEQIIVALALLMGLLGWVPTALGVLVMLASIPLESRLLALTKDLREAASALTDDRVKAVSEAIQGVKVVKLYAWELSFVERILGKRRAELALVRSAMVVNAWNSTLTSSLPTLLSLATFSAYAFVTSSLDAAVIFPSIALFNILRPPLLIFPFTAVSCARAAASVSRLQHFLVAEELRGLSEPAHCVPPAAYADGGGFDVVASDASFSWHSGAAPVRPSLAGVSLRVPRGALVCVVGQTGCGKSTLLASLLGEVPIVSGRAGIRPGRSVSFADQVPFIQNASIRANVLFGRELDMARYRRVLRACCLGPDLRILPAGDLTEIGSRGTNLSGGQRARVAMARAAYAQADVALLDDPLCAVDAHVGRTMFEKCVVGEMRAATRVMTTNQIHFATAPSVDFIAVLRHGELVEFGPRAALLQDPASALSQLVESAGALGGFDANGHGAAANGNAAGDGDEGDMDDDGVDDLDGIVMPSAKEPKTSLMTDSAAGEKTQLLAPKEAVKEWGSGRLVGREEKSEGRVQWRHYAEYMRAAGGLRPILLIVFLAVSSQACALLVNVWLSIWSEHSVVAPSAAENHSSMLYYLSVYIMIGVFSIVITSLMAFAIAFSSIQASVTLHENMLLSVFGAPSSWFMANPVGRIVNRFNSDIDKVDSTLASTLQSFSRLTLSLIGALCLILYATPWFVVAIIPVACVFLYVQEFYRKSSVDLRRLESVARSPLYSHFAEVLDGVKTIRAFRSVPQETRSNHKYTDSLNRITYVASTANRWLSVRLEALGTVLIFSAACLAVSSAGVISPSLTGLVLAYAMQLLGQMTWSVRQFTEMESQMSAIERIAEFSTSPPFPQEETGGLKATLQRRASNPGINASDVRGLLSNELSHLFEVRSQKRRSWPRRGSIKFHNITMRYRADLEPALRGVSLDISPGEHIGIVGRTGAGKSSLLSILFRLHEYESGNLLVDGVDIGKMHLFDLRSSLSVIPQEPYCFSGTIRSNLDMFREYDDASVQEALDGCGLQGTMTTKVSLDFEVQENGQNLSVGQRQLLCLGRALLRNSQILILDEATSSVSNDTDEKIQSTLRAEMGNCTVLTVAHRLHTVMSSDRIVVMERGKIAEVGRPADLLADRDSMLSALVDETGPSTAGYLRRIASGGPRGNDSDVKAAMSKRISGCSFKSPSAECFEKSEIHRRTRAAYAELREVMEVVDSPDWGKDLMCKNATKLYVTNVVDSLYSLSRSASVLQAVGRTNNHYQSIPREELLTAVTIDVDGTVSENHALGTDA